MPLVEGETTAHNGTSHLPHAGASLQHLGLGDHPGATPTPPTLVGFFIRRRERFNSLFRRPNHLYNVMMATDYPNETLTTMLRRCLLIALLVATSIICLPSLNAAPPPERSIVVLTAKWCANCRRVLPTIQSAANGAGVTPRLIDVDDPNAPKQAKRYGIVIRGKTLPMVYVINQGQLTEVLNGSQVTYGQNQALHHKITRQLEP